MIAQTRKGDRKNIVMAGAHLDSVAEGEGINDNGSGSAALLETAEAMAKGRAPKNKVRFTWWGAEELGLLGSEHYVTDLSENRPARFQNIALYLNFDMVSSPNYILGVYDGNNNSFPPEQSATAPEGSAAIERTFHRFFDKLGTDSVEALAGAGGVLGALIAPFVIDRMRTGHLTMSVAWVWVPLLVPLVFWSSPWLVGAMLFVGLLLNPAGNAAGQSYRVAITPTELQGRIASSSQFLSMTTIPFAPLLGGWLLETWGGSTAPVCGGVLTALIPTLSRSVAACRDRGTGRCSTGPRRSLPRRTPPESAQRARRVLERVVRFLGAPALRFRWFPGYPGNQHTPQNDASSSR